MVAPVHGMEACFYWVTYAPVSPKGAEPQIPQNFGTSSMHAHKQQPNFTRCEETFYTVDHDKGGFRGGGKGAMPTQMRNIVQHDTETTQC